MMDDRNRTREEAGTSVLMKTFIIAWGCCTLFYFIEYAVRAAPAVMVPELGRLFGVSPLGVSAILGMYYYTYATTSLIAGMLLDNFGGKYVIGSGAFVLGIGCLIFSMASPLLGDTGRLLQGAGSAFAFTGAVYLASHGFQAQRLATAVGVTQTVGMLGGSVGQLAVGPLIKGHLTAPAFWIVIGGLAIGVALVLMTITPTEHQAKKSVLTPTKWYAPYRTVFSNPQSYLCGAIAGLLFAPTTILDMVWGVRFLQQDSGLAYGVAVFNVSMVPFGWAIGCPLLGWAADHWHRRKPALIAGAALMLACIAQLTYLPSALPTWLSLLLFGMGSGAAMIPYTTIKEVNPDEVKGSAIGAMNFLTFAVTGVIGPIFAGNFGRSLGTNVDHVAHLRQSNLFWIFIIVFALLLTMLLRETGKHGKITAPDAKDSGLSDNPRGA